MFVAHFVHRLCLAEFQVGKDDADKFFGLLSLCEKKVSFNWNKAAIKYFDL